MSSTKGVDEKMKRKSKTYHQCRKLAELAFIEAKEHGKVDKMTNESIPNGRKLVDNCIEESLSSVIGLLEQGYGFNSRSVVQARRELDKALRTAERHFALSQAWFDVLSEYKKGDK